MQVQLLGPVRIEKDGTHLDIPSAGQRVVLGVLGLADGHPVSRAELIKALWQENPPPSAVNVIQTHVKHLRQVLEPSRPARTRSAVLPSVGDGYLLQAEVDVASFRRYVADARAAHRAGDHPRVTSLVADGLRLWRGTAPLADVPCLAGHPKVVALVEERLAALGIHGEALLATGAVREAVAVLEEAAHAQPLEEAAQARLIRTYQAAGRRAKAFDTYHETRSRLADDLGIDPGPELAASYAALLTGGETPASQSRAPHRRLVPATLPGDVTTFVGRHRELAELDQLLTPEPIDDAAMLITVVSGTGGVGKTALAIRWAHRMRHRFPDGQLYVDLRGYDPGQPMSGEDALARLLSALGLHSQEIPVDVEDRAARYRTEISRRRMLVVLDNASSVDQVRSLLPGTSSCVVVVTSRDSLGELVALHGARRLTLDLLPLADATELVRRLIGDRVDTAPAAGEALATQCVGLPLALRVAAELAVTRRTTPLTTLVAELADRRRRLGLLDTVGSVRPSVSAVFSSSYQHLPPDAARMFRLLGLHPGPQIALNAAAALAGRPVSQTRQALDSLTRAHLVQMVGQSRFDMHDLLRAYATELAHGTGSLADRSGAEQRLVEYYLHASRAADQLLDPHRDPIELDPAGPDVSAEEFVERDGAVAWFTLEHHVLLAVIHAAEHRFDRHVGPLARTLGGYLEHRGHWQDWISTQRAALEAAHRLADRWGIATAHRELGRAHARMGRYADADTYLQRALVLFTELDDARGQAHCHNNLTLVLDRHGRYHEALEQARKALVAFRAAGSEVGAARALNNMGWCHLQLTQYKETIVCCRDALARQQDIGDRTGESATWDTMGLAYHHVGRHTEAISCFQRGRDICHEFGDRFNEAALLAHLGDAANAAGDLDTARVSWQRALEIFDELGHTDMEQLDDKLRSLPVPPPG